MDMQEKQLPIVRGEDPSLPWPDSGGKITTLKSAPDALPTAATKQNQHSGESLPPVQSVMAAAPMCDEQGGENMGGTEENMPMQPIDDSINPRLLSLAMGFVPYQAWETPYDFDTGLSRATIFPSLDMPWHGEEVLRR